MSDVKINYYEVKVATPLWELDEMNKVALPVKLKKDKKQLKDNVWTIEKGKFVKSFGQVRNLKTSDNDKQEFLVLVNGSGILMKDVVLYKDEVDDCGCDGNPIATPTDIDKLSDEMGQHKEIDKESAYLNASGAKKSRFDKNAVIGLVLGAVIGAAIMWYSTNKDKKKTVIGAVTGAVIGMLVGYFLGRRGTKKTETVAKLDQITREVNPANVDVVQAGAKTDSDKQDFFQLGQTYDFAIPYPVYAMIYENNTFYVAKDKNGGKAVIKPNGKVRGKLVEVKDPNIFIAEPSTKKVVKIVSNKPLPFLDLGNSIFIPLAVVEPSSRISLEEAMKFLNGGGGLEEEIYVKGRYAGKRLFYLMYMPAHAAIINQTYGSIIMFNKK